MKRVVKLLSVMMLALALIMPAKAADFIYTAIPGTETEFDKYLLVDEEAEVPAVEFSYTVEGVAKKAATPGSVMEVIGTNVAPHNTMPKMFEKTTYADATAAETANKLNKLNFTKGQTKSTDTTDEWVELGDNQAFAKRTMVVDFTGVEFDEPGIYRYKITEANSTTPTLQGLSYDTQSKNKDRIRYLDVYVTETGSKTLEIAGYVLHEDDDQITPVTELNGSLNTTETEWYYDNNDGNATNDTYTKKAEAEAAATTVGEAKAAAAYATEIVYIDDDQDPNYLKYMYNGYGYDFLAEAEQACKDDYVAAEKAKIKPTKVELDDKSQGYVNELATYDLEFGKEVEGNQGSKDKYFKFTVTLEGLTEGTILQLDVVTKAEKNPTKNSATKDTYKQGTTMKDANSIDEDNDDTNGQQLVAPASGIIEKTFYLQDGQYIAIKGIPAAVEYTVAEDEEDYKKTEGTDVATKQVLRVIGDNLDNKHFDPVQGVMGEKVAYDKDNTKGMYWKDGDVYKKLIKVEDVLYVEYTDATTNTPYVAATHGDRYRLEKNVFTGYTNTRDGIIPTGVAMGIAGMVAILVIVGAYTVIRRRNAIYED